MQVHALRHNKLGDSLSIWKSSIQFERFDSLKSNVVANVYGRLELYLADARNNSNDTPTEGKCIRQVRL